MFAVLIYRYDRDRSPIFDRAVSGFASQEAALQWAEHTCQFQVGQDFSVVPLEDFWFGPSGVPHDR